MALALLLAGTLRAEAVLAIANLVWVLLLGLGVLVARRPLPGAWHLAAVLPSGALGDGLRAAFVHGHLATAAWACSWCGPAVATVLASRSFRWGD